MRVGIVGAGICGLSAARYLHKSGHEAVVFERSSSVGGRVSTFSKDGFTWDTGATSIAPRGKSIEKVIRDELTQTGLVHIDKPIYTHTGLRVSPGRPSGTARYVYEDGIETLAKRLAEGLEVRLEQMVEAIDKRGAVYDILGEDFDAIILTPPAPQSTLLLWHLGESRPMANVKYRACLSVLLGYSNPLPPTNYHALIDLDQMHPLTWLSLESVKSPGRAPENGCALVAQLSASYSLSQYERPDDSLVETVTGFIERLYGPAFESPDSWAVVRWKYSQPESFGSFENVNGKGSRLLVASDALLGGHIEDAFEVGTRTAKLLVEED